MMTIAKHMSYLAKQIEALTKKKKTQSSLLIQCQHLMNYINCVPKHSNALHLLFQDVKKHTVKDFPLFVERVLSNFKSEAHLGLIKKYIQKFQFHKNLYRVLNVFVFMGVLLGGSILAHTYGWSALPVWLVGAWMFNYIEKCAEKKFNQAFVMKKTQVLLSD